MSTAVAAGPQGTITRNQVVAAIKEVLATFKHWKLTGKPTIVWGPYENETQTMSEQLEEQLHDLCLFCNVIDVDDETKEVILEIDRVQTELEAWTMACQVNPASTHPGGSEQLISAIELLERCLAVRPTRQPEKMTDLIDMGVSDEQICKMYGFLKPDGSADMLKLAEEKREPGTHYNPETWINPARAGELREVNARWERRTPPNHVPYSDRPHRETPPAPESIEELIAQGVDGDQIALMKNMPLHEVEEFARIKGLPLEGRVVRHPHEEQETEEFVAAVNARRSELLPVSHEDIKDRDERIMACAVDGMNVQDIALVMQLDYPGLEWPEVNRVIQGQTTDEQRATD